MILIQGIINGSFISYYLALNYQSLFFYFRSVAVKTLQAAFNDYGFLPHLNNGLDSTLTNIYDNYQ